MGWTCQHDLKGHCKLLNVPCVPGIKGCILGKSEYTFSTGNFEEDKKKVEERTKQIDFAALARSN